MITKKILPINPRPILRNNHNTAFSFAVLEALEIPHAWILERFLVLKYSDLLTYDQPFFLNWKCFSRKINIYIPGMKISKSIIKYLNKNYYVYMELNEFYIPNRQSYKEKNFYHDILICGFDLDKKSFLTIAYDDKGLFSPQWVNFENIDDAYFNYKRKYLLKVMPFRVTERYNFFKENKTEIIQKLRIFLHPNSELLGINAYNVLLNEIKNNKQDKVRIDLRSYRTIYEFNNILIFLNEVFDIPESFQQELLSLKKQATIIFNLAIKYSLTLNESILCRIELNLTQLIKVTNIILTAICDFLEEFI